MNEFKGTSNFAIRPETCPLQVQAFLKTSAEYLGLTLDADGCRLAARPEMPLAGYRDHFAPTQMWESSL